MIKELSILNETKRSVRTSKVKNHTYMQVKSLQLTLMTEDVKLNFLLKKI